MLQNLLPNLAFAGGKWKMIWTINYKKTDTYSGVSLV